MVITIQKDIILKSGFKIRAKRDVRGDGHGRPILGRLRCYISIAGIVLDISEESYELLSAQMEGLKLNE